MGKEKLLGTLVQLRASKRTWFESKCLSARQR